MACRCLRRNRTGRSPPGARPGHANRVLAVVIVSASCSRSLPGPRLAALPFAWARRHASARWRRRRGHPTVLPSRQSRSAGGHHRRYRLDDKEAYLLGSSRATSCTACSCRNSQRVASRRRCIAPSDAQAPTRSPAQRKMTQPVVEWAISRSSDSVNNRPWAVAMRLPLCTTRPSASTRPLVSLIART
jgi:hypothetical protein